VGRDDDCRLVAWRDRQVVRMLRIGNGSQAYPRIGATRIYYRDNTSDTHAYVRSLKLEDIEAAPETIAEGDIFGERPIAVNERYVAWQRRENGIGMVYRSSRVDGSLAEPVRTAQIEGQTSSQGLLRIDTNGHVVLADEGRFVDTAAGRFTMPCFAGGVFAAEGRESGCEMWYGGLRHVEFPGQECFTPRLAFNPLDQTYGVVTHGREGVRVETAHIEQFVPWEPEETDDMNPPKIAVTHYDPVCRAGSPWRLEWEDPENKQRFSVRIDVDGQLTIKHETPVGSDQTGARRRVRVTG
jgi:hypothetical protein